MTAAMQVEIALRQIQDSGDSSFSTEISFGGEPGAPGPTLRTIRLERAAGCPFHEETGNLLPLPPGASAADVLEPIASARPENRPVLLLDWPVCVHARCVDCGLEWEPRRRVAAVKRSCRCPRCGSRYLDDLRTVHSLDASSTWSTIRLTDLGVPENHLLTVGFSGESA
jgi:predicted Zn-ribbon and HTH transcriptional regulator